MIIIIYIGFKKQSLVVQYRCIHFSCNVLRFVIDKTRNHLSHLCPLLPSLEQFDT